jgi:hypothetical protein
MDQISLKNYVDTIAYQYDRNGNGVIDLDKDENYYDENLGGQVTRYSFDELFINADKNKDNKVTRDEINSVVSEYDTNKDGKLSLRNFWEYITGKPEGEWEVFNRKMPERSWVISTSPFPNRNSLPVGDFPENPAIKNMA